MNKEISNKEVISWLSGLAISHKDHKYRLLAIKALQEREKRLDLIKKYVYHAGLYDCDSDNSEERISYTEMMIRINVLGECE